jgi:hypothetical protein
MRMDGIISQSEVKSKAMLAADKKGICVNFRFEENRNPAFRNPQSAGRNPGNLFP